MLTRSFLGEDEVWPVYQEPNDYGYTSTSVDNVPTIYQASYPASVPVNEGINWSNIWGGVKDVIGPISQAAANIIRATSGQPQPSNPNVVRNAAGQLVPVQSSTSTWLIPALLIGGGAIYMMNRKKRR
jgi:hypothetical protein